MRQLYYLYFMLALLLLQSCKTEPPAQSATRHEAPDQMMQLHLKATTTRQVFYQNIPSASALEHVQGSFYVLGDDSPYLYRLNGKYELVQRYALFDTTGFENGRIPKDKKPDLESMTLFTYGRDNMLLLLGSGATSAREKGYLVNLTDRMQVQELNLSSFYTFLRQVLQLQQEGELNLEGLAMDKVYTYLLQRPAGTGVNVLLRFDTDAFKDFILGHRPMPAVALYYFTLPQLAGLPSGFSGAYALEGRLFFTASVEDTPNAIDDGQVHGSFVGLLDLRALPAASDAANPLQVLVVQLLGEDGTAYVGKAESLVVLPGEEKMYKVIVVSDDDKGHSELLELALEVEERP